MKVVALAEVHMPSLLRLVEEAHWNQNADDWRYMLAQGRGWGLDRGDGTLVASTVVLPYGAFGWISMVLVSPDQRRRGHASRLMQIAIDSLRAEGRMPVLDATPAGQTVYEQMGFVDGWRFERWQRKPGMAVIADEVPEVVTVRRLTNDDWPSVIAADAKAFGTRRESLLRALAGRWLDGPLVAVRDGQTVGALFARAGHSAFQLGPMCTDGLESAVRLIDEAVRLIGGPVFADVPMVQGDLAQALAARGFVVQRPFTRMALAGASPGDNRLMRLVAGPELG